MTGNCDLYSHPNSCIALAVISHQEKNGEIGREATTISQEIERELGKISETASPGQSAQTSARNSDTISPLTIVECLDDEKQTPDEGTKPNMGQYCVEPT